ncbi:MAG: hypothetical protein ABII18_11800 [bacterium]|nr:hypothetical protein [bacterium]MBU1917554.1 hypothetical protein [bacterium]
MKDWKDQSSHDKGLVMKRFLVVLLCLLFSFTALADDTDDGYEDVSLEADISSDVSTDETYASSDLNSRLHLL